MLFRGLKTIYRFRFENPDLFSRYVFNCQSYILIPCFGPFLHVYGELCQKCLHPMQAHTYVVAHADGREVRRCGIGVCPCIIMALRTG